jgi:predicted peptidase
MAGFPFMILAPVGEGGFEFWTKEALARDVMALVKETAQHYPVDEKRIYLMGDGLGAQGVWGLALQNPSTFAALVPVGGYASYPFKVPAKICDLKDVPVWAFHGGKDVYVPQTVQQDLVDALSACGGVARLSVHEDMTINILNIVYRNKDVYQWLAERSR